MENIDYTIGGMQFLMQKELNDIVENFDNYSKGEIKQKVFHLKEIVNEEI